MNKNITLLKCTPIDDLINLFDLVEGSDYSIVKYNNGIMVYQIKSSTSLSANLLFQLIKDINIFVPKVKTYLSDYLLCRLNPSKSIIDYINYFSMEDLFISYISQQRIRRETIKIQGKKG